MEWIFAEDNGVQGFLSMAKILGRYVMPDKYLYV